MTLYTTYCRVLFKWFLIVLQICITYPYPFFVISVFLSFALFRSVCNAHTFQHWRRTFNVYSYTRIPSIHIHASYTTKCRASSSYSLLGLIYSLYSFTQMLLHRMRNIRYMWPIASNVLNNLYTHNHDSSAHNSRKKKLVAESTENDVNAVYFIGRRVPFITKAWPQPSSIATFVGSRLKWNVSAVSQLVV